MLHRLWGFKLLLLLRIPILLPYGSSCLYCYYACMAVLFDDYFTIHLLTVATIWWYGGGITKLFDENICRALYHIYCSTNWRESIRRTCLDTNYSGCVPRTSRRTPKSHVNSMYCLPITVRCTRGKIRVGRPGNTPWTSSRSPQLDSRFRRRNRRNRL